MTATAAVSCVWPANAVLGEGTRWSVREQALYWVDTRRRRVRRWAPDSPLRHWDTPGDVGSIALARPGALVLALEDGFAALDLASGAVAPIAAIEGLTEEHQKHLAACGIKTIRDLGEWKFAAWARAIVELAKLEQ